jgi:hypothetical protein
MQAPNPMKSIIDQLATGGWDALNNFGAGMQEQLAKQSEEAQREARIVIDALDNEAGRRFVDWLKSKTIERRPSAEEKTALSIDQFAIANAWRGGQNSVAWMILDVLNYKGEKA